MPRLLLLLHQELHQPQRLQLATPQQQQQQQAMMPLRLQRLQCQGMGDLRRLQRLQPMRQPQPQQHPQVTMKRMMMRAIRHRQRLLLMKTRTANSHKIPQIYFSLLASVRDNK
jgi:hypothetical protein